MQHNQNYRKEIEEGEKEKRLKEYNRLRFSKVFFSFLLLPINQSILILQLTQLSVFFFFVFFFSIGQNVQQHMFLFCSCGLKLINFDSPIDVLCVCECLSVEKCIELARIGNSLGKSINKLLFMFVFILKMYMYKKCCHLIEN